jgi:hypothetical protein
MPEQFIDRLNPLGLPSDKLSDPFVTPAKAGVRRAEGANTRISAPTTPRVLFRALPARSWIPASAGMTHFIRKRLKPARGVLHRLAAKSREGMSKSFPSIEGMARRKAQVS